MRPILPLSILLALAAPAAAQTELGDCPADARERIERDSAQERAWRERVGELRAAIVAESPGDTAGYVVLEVDSATRRARVLFVDVDVSDSLRARVAGTMIQPLAGVLPTDGRHFRVAARAGEERPWCSVPGEPPELENAQIVSRGLARVADEYRERTGTAVGTREVLVKMLLSAEGRPALVLLQEFTGDEWLDQKLGEAARELRFRPARMGNHPQDIWVTLPITITDQPPGAS
jgi:hypothetical protein